MSTESKEKVFYFGIYFGCIIAFPISTPYLDLFFISIYLILMVKGASGHKKSFGFSKSIDIPSIALFLFFFLRDLFSLINFFEVKTLRILLVHLVLFILLIVHSLQLNPKINYKIILRISIIYFAFYNIYYFIILLTGQNWATLQTVYLTGSVYASIPFLFTSYMVLENSSNKTLRFEYFLTILALTSAILYSSRSLLLFILFFIGIYFFKSKVELRKRLKFVFGCLFLTISMSWAFGVFVSYSNDFRIGNDSDIAIVEEDKIIETNKSVIRFFEDLTSSAFFLVENKRDDDRKAHILCALESLENRTLINNLIGSGTNTYRHTLASCSQFGGQGYSDNSIKRENKGSQSISFTIIMLDYGLFAYILFFSLFAKRLYDFYQSRVSLTYLLYFLLNFYLFFVTNLGVTFIVWLFFTSKKMYQTES